MPGKYDFSCYALVLHFTERNYLFPSIFVTLRDFLNASGWFWVFFMTTVHVSWTLILCSRHLTYKLEWEKQASWKLISKVHEETKLFLCFLLGTDSHVNWRTLILPQLWKKCILFPLLEQGKDNRIVFPIFYKKLHFILLGELFPSQAFISHVYK